MLSQNEIQEIVHQLCQNLDQIFPGQKKDIILFGSYARGEVEYGSDIDLMILIDTDRNQIMSKNREIGEAAGELLLKYGVLVSPIIENRDYFIRHTGILPFYRNIKKEGVKLSA